MISSQSSYNSRDGAGVNAKFHSYLAEGNAPRSLEADFCNIFVGELPNKSVNSSLSGVKNVIDVGNPFQVGSGVVGLNQINMIDLRKIEGVGDKRLSDEPVDGNVSRLRPDSPKVNKNIAATVCAQTSLPPRPDENTSRFTGLRSREASHSPEITDLVKGPELGGVNGSPFFFDWGMHGVDRPSGEVGLAFENPSCAKTLGGFAIDSKTPPAKQDIGGVFCR